MSEPAEPDAFAPPRAVWALWGYVALVAVTCTLALYLLPRVHLEAGSLTALALRWAGLPLLALYCRFRRAWRLAHAARVIAWGTLFSALYALPMYLCAARPGPLRDPWLAALDARLGAPAPALVHLVARHPLAQTLFVAAYDLLLPFSLLALALPALLSPARAGYRFLLALVLASAVSLALFALVPAAGPWLSYDVAPTPSQRAGELVLRALRSGRPVALDLRAPVPLITMPSWHALLAMLAAFSLAQVRYLAAPAALLGAAIVLSTLTTGWHYASDVLAGCGLALLAWWAAGRLVPAALPVAPRSATYTPAP